MSDARRTRQEQWRLYQTYRAGEPWYVHPRVEETWRPPTLEERIDRLERDLKMGKYAE